MSKKLPTLATTDTDVVLADMQTDVVLHLDDVVNVFCSHYETAVHEEHARLKQLISQAQSDKADAIQFELDDAKTSEKYNITHQLLGLESKVKSVEANTKNVVIRVVVKSTDSHEYLNKVFYSPMKKSTIKHVQKWDDEIRSLTSELAVVMTNIASIPRKERQIRGQISQMKLEQTGFSDLLKDPTMLKLINM